MIVVTLRCVSELFLSRVITGQWLRHSIFPGVLYVSTFVCQETRKDFITAAFSGTSGAVFSVSHHYKGRAQTYGGSCDQFSVVFNTVK